MSQNYLYNLPEISDKSRCQFQDNLKFKALVYLGGPQVLKRAEILPGIGFFAMKKKSLLKPRSHHFWHDYNLSKHVSIAFATFWQRERVLTN